MPFGTEWKISSDRSAFFSSSVSWMYFERKSNSMFCIAVVCTVG